jgi:hypothetical protein
MLVEARGRAGPHLRGIVRHAERTSPGAFLTRLRGEATDVHAIPRDPRVRAACARIAASMSIERCS